MGENGRGTKAFGQESYHMEWHHQIANSEVEISYNFLSILV